MIIQTAVEPEVEAFLGRARYQRAAGAAPDSPVVRAGHRNGYSQVTVNRRIVSLQFEDAAEVRAEEMPAECEALADARFGFQSSPLATADSAAAASV